MNKSIIGASLITGLALTFVTITSFHSIVDQNTALVAASTIKPITTISVPTNVQTIYSFDSTTGSKITYIPSSNQTIINYNGIFFAVPTTNLQVVTNVQTTPARGYVSIPHPSKNIFGPILPIQKIYVTSQDGTKVYKTSAGTNNYPLNSVMVVIQAEPYQAETSAGKSSCDLCRDKYNAWQKAEIVVARSQDFVDGFAAIGPDEIRLIKSLTEEKKQRDVAKAVYEKCISENKLEAERAQCEGVYKQENMMGKCAECKNIYQKLYDLQKLLDYLNKYYPGTNLIDTVEKDISNMKGEFDRCIKIRGLQDTKTQCEEELSKLIKK